MGCAFARAVRVQAYFPIKDHREHLHKQLREEFVLAVNRSTPTDKIQDFMVKGDMLVENMKYLGRITSNPILEVRAKLARRNTILAAVLTTSNDVDHGRPCSGSLG